MTERIVCAAMKVKLNNNDTVIIASPRHWDNIAYGIIDRLDIKIFGDRDDPEHGIQGFLDQFGNFHTRKQAYIIALANNQIIRRVGGDEGVLYSENLY